MRNPLPANTIAVFVSGGQVQWAASGPHTHVEVIIMDADTQEMDYDLDEPISRVWGINAPRIALAKWSKRLLIDLKEYING